MFDVFKATGWRHRFIAPALKQAALRNGHVAEQPDLMILIELWLWAVFFRFSGDYRALAPDKQAKLRSEAFQLSYFDYYNLHKARLVALMRELEPKLGLTEPSMVLIGFQQLIRPTFEHSVIEAQHLPPLHENFDVSTFRRVLSKVHPSFLEMPGMNFGVHDDERQHNLKLVTQVAAVGQAQLYAKLTGMLIPADIVLVDDAHIPDLADVFISYARSDGHFVTELAAQLQQAGIKVWYDRRIQPETQFDQAISNQISAAKVILTVWSSAAVNSKWVRAESLAGFNADKLMQLRFGDCAIPTPFNIVQTIEAETEGLAPEAYVTLIQAIRRMIGASPSSEPVGPLSVGIVPRNEDEPWYYDHKTWREALIVPALRESEPILFLKDPMVGYAATLLLETFFWGYALSILQLKVPPDRMEHIIPILTVTAPTQFCEAAKQRGANIGIPISMQFITLFHRLIGASVKLVENELNTKGKLETPPNQLFQQFLIQSEAIIPPHDRHAAFPVSGEDGDALLGVAALVDNTKLFKVMNLTVLQQ